MANESEESVGRSVWLVRPFVRPSVCCGGPIKRQKQSRRKTLDHSVLHEKVDGEGVRAAVKRIVAKAIETQSNAING